MIPGFKSFTIPLCDTEALFISPWISFIVKINFWPCYNITGSANFPRLISGPFVSKIHGNFRSNSFSIFLNLWILSKCSGWVPWEKLNRAPSKPSLIKPSKALHYHKLDLKYILFLFWKIFL